MKEYRFLDRIGVAYLWKRMTQYVNGIIPKKLSQLENDEGYMTNGVTSVNGSKGDVTISVPTKVSQLQNDCHYITESGAEIPENISYFNNDAGYITGAALGNYALKSELFSGNYGDLANAPIKGPISASELDNITEPGIYFVEGVNELGLPTYSWVTVGITYSAARPNRYIQTIVGGGEIKIRSKTESSSYDNWTIPYQKPKTTLEGYGITDAKIENGVITLGNNTVDTNSYLLSSAIFDWAKASTKPSYTAAEVGALPADTPLPTGIPAGGTTGQVLKKTSDSNYAVEWSDEEGGGSGDENIIETVKVNGTALNPDSNKAVDIDLSGYALISDVPAAVTESTVSGWGFTKNTGTYSKPSTGIPASDLATGVIPDISGKEDKVAIATTLPATLEVGKYYRLGTVGTLSAALPTVSDTEHAASIMIGLTASADITPALTSSASVYYQEGFEIKSGGTYEINCLWNGSYWCVTAIKFETT